MSRWFSPASLVWVACHILIVAIGVFFAARPTILAFLSLGMAQGIGGSLIATGIAGELMFLYIRASDTVRARLDVFLNAGLFEVFPTRSIQIRDQYTRRLVRAREIDVLGFGQSSLRQDYGEEFVAWSHRATVRILLLDPEFPSGEASYADERDREEHNAAGQIRRDVEMFRATLAKLQGLNQDRFQVRLMKALPSVNFFRVDDEIFWGPYLIGHQSRNTPTLLVKRGGFLFEKLKGHFDTLWGDDYSSPMDLEVNGRR